MTTTSRRAFFRTFAGISFASVMLRHFVSTAAQGSFPIRFVFVFVHDGQHSSSKPSGTGTGFSLGPTFQALEPWKNKLLLLDGMQIPEHVNEEHPNGRCAMLTGLPSTEKWTSNGISIDRFLATALTNGESIYTGSDDPGGSDSLDPEISWHAAGIANRSHLTGDSALFDAVFSGMGGPGQPMPVDDDAAERRRDNELALNGFLAEDVKRLEKLAPAEEREKLRLHLEALSQLRADIQAGTGSGSGPVLIPPASCDAALSVTASAQIDRSNQVIAHALACGRSRIVLHNFDGYEPHHEHSHDADTGTTEPLLTLDRKYAQHFANLLGYLDSFAEGDGTLLDNTIVVLSSEVSGTYGGGDLHGTADMPLVLAGGKNAGLRNGERVATSGFWNTELYRAIAVAMGVSDTSGYGDPARPNPLAEVFAT